MKVDFLIPAEYELEEAIDYYNIQSEGLGFEFAAEVKRTIGRILEYPKAWTTISPRTRRCRTNRFPYGIIYQERANSILIIAVMHLSKHPDSWKSRLNLVNLQ